MGAHRAVLPQLSILIGQIQVQGYNSSVVSPGGHIGQYRILEKLGAGGMGTVFLAEHVLLKRRAAIKTLLPSLSVHPEIVERFFTEARATSAISDPGVVQVFDFGYHVDGTAYIVLELLEGEALGDRLERLKQLALGDALRIARQVASALAAAHDLAIVHRDLKPENVFLLPDAESAGGERAKVLDFGICKLAVPEDEDPAGITQEDTMLGTPVYMSPEQCRGASRADHRTDIYALGCVLFHMIAGRPPFECDGVGEYMAAHLHEPAPRLRSLMPEVPEDVDALVARCMEKDAGDRFQSMAELHAALGAAYTANGGAAAGAQVMPLAPKTPLGTGFRSGPRNKVITNLPTEDALPPAAKRVKITAGTSAPDLAKPRGGGWRKIGSLALALLLVAELGALLLNRLGGDDALAGPVRVEPTALSPGAEAALANGDLARHQAAPASAGSAADDRSIPPSAAELLGEVPPAASTAGSASRSALRTEVTTARPEPTKLAEAPRPEPVRRAEPPKAEAVKPEPAKAAEAPKAEPKSEPRREAPARAREARIVTDLAPTPAKPAPAPSSISSPAPAAPPAAPTEDLYDTR